MTRRSTTTRTACTGTATTGTGSCPGTDPLSLYFLLRQMLDEPIAPEKPQQPQRREFNCRRTGKTVSYCGPASVIIDRAQAARMYTARRLFALNKRQRDAKASSRSKSSSMTVGEAARQFSAAAKAYDDAGDAVHAYWEQRAREHDRRQPGILESILTVLEGDPTRSFDQVSADIGGWCSGDTIRRWALDAGWLRQGPFAMRPCKLTCIKNK